MICFPWVCFSSKPAGTLKDISLVLLGCFQMIKGSPSRPFWWPRLRNRMHPPVRVSVKPPPTSQCISEATRLATCLVWSNVRNCGQMGCLATNATSSWLPWGRSLVQAHGFRFAPLRFLILYDGAQAASTALPGPYQSQPDNQTSQRRSRELSTPR